jgi:tether containing UBX domain for GLUT4
MAENLQSSTPTQRSGAFTPGSSSAGDAPATEFKVYKPPSTTSAPLEELPDSYFTPSLADLKAAQATLSARTRSLVDAPLQVRAQREAAEKSKRDRWPNTTIRVRFSDRTQLEKIFPSTDKIRSVYAFVRSSLRDDVKSIKFILYQSPPKRDLKVSDPDVRDLSLAQLQLAPSSVLLLRFEDESLNGTNVPAPLLPSIAASAIELPKPPSVDTEPPKVEKSATLPATASSTRTEKKVPKWLKAGLRK